MKILPLLRKHLKDDEIIRWLEDWDVEVIYDFDRLHENIPDVYWASAKECGITLRFDHDQCLDTVFVYVQAGEGHEAMNPAFLEDITLFDSLSQVEAYAANHLHRIKTGLRPATLPPEGRWIRLDYDQHQVHYEFRDGILHMITISSASALKMV